MTNPFKSSELTSLRELPPCAVVIFGASGDLTSRKLVPALYNLFVDGLLPKQFEVIGVARRDMSGEAFVQVLEESLKAHSRRKLSDKATWQTFSSHVSYLSSEFDAPKGYALLKEKLEALDRESGIQHDRIFYLATSPDYFEIIPKQLSVAGLLNSEHVFSSESPGLARIIIEKPFGHDLASGRGLNRALASYAREDQIYRIDHYLGKETVQNLLVFRFSNGIFEPIWNHKYISHVEISVCESVGVGNRAGYFDRAGILRDIVQNHVMQLLCLVALEPPVAFEADAVRDEKVKVLRSVRVIPQSEVSQKAVRGRYLAGHIAGKDVPGYLAEPGVSEDSVTETFAAMELMIDNWRWAGVPFFIRAGKRLPKRVTEISVHFHKVPLTLFSGEEVDVLRPNILSFQIQPDEGISLKISAKPPGPKVQVQPVNMEFSYGTSFGVEPPEAYERLLLDCMRKDATLFTRNDEIEESWKIVMPILGAWSDKGYTSCPVYGYKAGTWGPVAADELISKRGGISGWRRL